MSLINSPAQQKRPVGRPKTITDMKAYKREKARQYRSEIKAGKAAKASALDPKSKQR